MFRDEIKNAVSKPATIRKRLKSLTDQEREVLGYLIQGYNNRQMPELMGLSLRAVEWHIGNMKSKMRCETQNQLMLSVALAEFSGSSRRSKVGV